MCVCKSNAPPCPSAYVFLVGQKREQRCTIQATLALTFRSVFLSLDNSVADIVRLLFMVPLYAIISFASYLFWVRYLKLPSWIHSHNLGLSE